MINKQWTVEELKELLTKSLLNIKDEDILLNISNAIGQILGVSDHTKWRVQTSVEKFNVLPTGEKELIPFETIKDGGNIIVDNGASTILKLMIAYAGTTPFDNTHAKIQIGSNNTTAEASTQTGVIAPLPNGILTMDSGFPKWDAASPRQIEFQATADGTQANGAWNEFGVTNGSITMNRKIPTNPEKTLGSKASQTIWTIKVIISIA